MSHFVFHLQVKIMSISILTQGINWFINQAHRRIKMFLIPAEEIFLQRWRKGRDIRCCWRWWINLSWAPIPLDVRWKHLICSASKAVCFPAAQYVMDKAPLCLLMYANIFSHKKKNLLLWREKISFCVPSGAKGDTGHSYLLQDSVHQH